MEASRGGQHKNTMGRLRRSVCAAMGSAQCPLWGGSGGCAALGAVQCPLCNCICLSNLWSQGLRSPLWGGSGGAGTALQWWRHSGHYAAAAALQWRWPLWGNGGVAAALQ